MTPFKQNETKFPMICIVGATATGKTRLGVELAKQWQGEVISADSRQVYRGLDIGAGKDLDEYGSVPYHLIDIAGPSEEFNVFEYIKAFNAAQEDICRRQKLPILVGGTGMYLDAVLNRYRLTVSSDHNTDKYQELSDEELVQQLLSLNPNLHNSTDLTDRKRTLRAIALEESILSGNPAIQAPALPTLVLGIDFSREEIRRRITLRLKERLENGLLEEVEHLHQLGLSWQQLDFFGLEYRFVARHLQGELSYNDMYQKLNAAIHQFAKQQLKWFRNIEKKGIEIQWLAAGSTLLDEANHKVQHFLGHSAKPEP